MSSYILDYDARKKKGTLTSHNLDIIRECFSIEDQAAKFNRRFGNKFIPLRKFAITPAGKFEAGLALDIYRKIIETDPNGKVQFTNVLKNQVLPGQGIPLEQIINTSNYDLRPYQAECVQTLIRRGRGIAMVATSGGKTLIMHTLISTLNHLLHNRRVVVIVPTQLAKQTYDEFRTYNPTYSATWWTGQHKPNQCAQVIVCGNKILLSKKQDIKWLFDADILLCDEVHNLRYANKLNRVIKKFTTNERFGFTGTLPEDLLDQWTIKGLIGPVVYKKTAAELREDNYISDANVQIAKMIYSELPEYPRGGRPTAAYNVEIDFIIKHPFRNHIIKKISAKCDNNVLILVDRLEHGETLKEMLDGIPGKEVFFIKGEVENEERDRIKALIEEKNNIVCIAITTIFGTGINIKNLHYIIFAAIGKARTRVIQTIGRGLRLHENKKQLVIFDIYDDLRYGKKHHTKRIKLYDKEKLRYRTKEIYEDLQTT